MRATGTRLTVCQMTLRPTTVFQHFQAPSYFYFHRQYAIRSLMHDKPSLFPSWIIPDIQRNQLTDCVVENVVDTWWDDLSAKASLFLRSFVCLSCLPYSNSSFHKRTMSSVMLLSSAVVAVLSQWVSVAFKMNRRWSHGNCRWWRRRWCRSIQRPGVGTCRRCSRCSLENGL